MVHLLRTPTRERLHRSGSAETECGDDAPNDRRLREEACWAHHYHCSSSSGPGQTRVRLRKESLQKPRGTADGTARGVDRSEPIFLAIVHG